tara:strand:+ start:1004 stop:1504 length:501 start_codon:yes stop_codon:yes gene_type:complete
VPDILDIPLRAAAVITAIILLYRLQGLRSFSKMSGFDFAITVSIGSVLAGAVTTPKTHLYIFLLALASLFAVQIIIARLRVASVTVQNGIDNAPLLVMENGRALPDNLRKAGMTSSDLRAKLREANAYNLDQVRAVIMETTGDVSVLHGPKDGPDISDEILSDVQR